MKCEWGQCQNETTQQISGKWTCPECDAHIQNTLRAVAVKMAADLEKKLKNLIYLM